MATSKTLAPTNVTISIPAMTDAPNASVISNCLDKEADAINALNSQISTAQNLLTNCDDALDIRKDYYANGSTANRPFADGWFHVRCVSRNGTMIVQEAVLMNTTRPDVYYRVSTSGGGFGPWRMINEPAIVNGEKTFSSIAAGAIATGYVDIQFPELHPKALTAFPAYTTSGLPITSVYLDTGAATGYQRVQFAVRNVTSSAVTNEKVTVKVLFM